MAEFSKKLLDMMTEFLISEIGAKALDGITYAMVLKNKKDKTLYNRYITIKQEAINCGYMNDDVFRVYEVANGYIFDMDLNTAKKITAELAKAENVTVGGQPTTDLIRDMPEQRRKRDMVALAKYLKSEYDSGKTEVEVALFNRNTTNTIIINGKAPNGKMIAV